MSRSLSEVYIDLRQTGHGNRVRNCQSLKLRRVVENEPALSGNLKRNGAVPVVISETREECRRHTSIHLTSDPVTGVPCGGVAEVRHMANVRLTTAGAKH